MHSRISSRESEKASPARSGGVDYGWRLHGRPVGVLSDRSFHLLPDSRAASAKMLAPYGVETKDLVSCLQCGMCTASCNLVEEGNQFPRHEMTLVQLGQRDRLLASTSIWHCYNCSDCSSSCPAEAGPGRVMAAVRRMAIEHYAFPGFLARAFGRPKFLPLLLLVAAALVLAAIAAGGSLSPEAGPVRYAAMFPHAALNLFFSFFTGLAVLGAARGVGRIWRAFVGEPLWRADKLQLARSLGAAFREIFTHKKFSECQQFPTSRWAHMAIVAGFGALATLAGTAALLILLGAPYPLPVLSPLKIAGNIAGALLLAGVACFMVQRMTSSTKGDRGDWFDWALLSGLAIVAVTGGLCEVFRYTGAPALAYPTYFVHLVFVFALLMGLPYSKLAHALYRTVAMTARRYGEPGLSLPARSPGKEAA